MGGPAGCKATSPWTAFDAAIATDPGYKMASYLRAALEQGWSDEEAAALFREAAAEAGY
ncbi:hypothetical protein [Streptomyces chartreusis]